MKIENADTFDTFSGYNLSSNLCGGFSVTANYSRSKVQYNPDTLIQSVLGMRIPVSGLFQSRENHTFTIFRQRSH